MSPARKPRKPKSVRGRRLRKPTAARVNHKARGRTAMVVLVALLAVALTKLVWIQTVDASAYAAAGQNQRESTIDLPAQRGQITDRNGVRLAFTIEGDRLAIRPAKFADDTQRGQVADVIMAAATGTAPAARMSKAKLLTQMSAKNTQKYVYIADNLLPEQAASILAKVRPLLLDKRLHLTPKQQDAALNAVVTERQDIREYPNTGIADTVIGKTGWDGDGLSGIENHFNATLAGHSGSRTVELDPQGDPIPGTVTNESDPTNGTSVQLTLDADVQYTAQQMLKRTVDSQGAHGGNMVVLDTTNGHLLALASYVPGKLPAQISNMTIDTPVEPGSVNKVVTFSAALAKGIITPETVLNVPGQITMGGITVGDAWPHDSVDMTATGILAKSSNVGTLMIAQRVGEQAFYQQLTKFGIGSRTGIELSGESAGRVPTWNANPAKSQWTASTFANLPIGQGVSMTVLQLACMYQGIANNGVRIPPTLIQSSTTNGVTSKAAPKAGTRVISVKTAQALRLMLTATTQGGDMVHDGTAPAAAITGYQVAGKTGTAQQVDPKTGSYSQSRYTTTFAGILPADNPRYVIAISLDRPSGDREGGTSAAPLFHNFGAYLMNAMNVPPSTSQPPLRELYLNLGG
ncbi:MAG: penicillin-binding protein 2 [Actinomycetota bacterium]|nr:penicillin-binding protein 2 [Actinomycetota bacterium]